MERGEHPHRQATQPPDRVTGLPNLPQRTTQGSEGETEGRNDTAPRAGGARSGPGRANREDDKHKPTSRRHDLTRMRTAIIIATILIGIVAIALLAVGCAP